MVSLVLRTAVGDRVPQSDRAELASLPAQSVGSADLSAVGRADRSVSYDYELCPRAGFGR